MGAIELGQDSGDYVRFTQLSNAQDIVSFAVWFYVPTTLWGQWTWPWCKRSSGAMDWWVEVATSPGTDEVQVFIKYTTGNMIFTTSNLNVAVDTWTFFAWAFNHNGGISNAYINAYKGLYGGTISAVSTTKGGTVTGSRTGTDPFEIGSATAGPAKHYCGFVSVFKKELTQTQFQRIMYDPLRASLVHGTDCELLVFPGLHGASDFPNFAPNGGAETADSGISLAPLGLPMKPPFGFAPEDYPYHSIGENYYDGNNWVSFRVKQDPT